MAKRFLTVAWVAAMGISALAWGAEAGSAASAAWDYKLDAGTVRIFNFGGIKLHAYQTNDAMADECFVLETADNLVAIESPAFENNVAEWRKYVAALNKPLTDVLLSYHPAGGKWYGQAVSHATEAAKRAITEGGTRKLTDSLKGAFGAGFSDDIPGIDRILKAGANSVGGIEFVITEDGDGYDIAIPAIRAVYLDMLGAKVHSILISVEHIDAAIAKLESFRKDGYTLFLSSHHTPETHADVDAKLAYLETARQIALKSADKNAFVAAMQANFPEYSGDNYLGMSADALFAEGSPMAAESKKEILRLVEQYRLSIDNADDISIAEKVWDVSAGTTFIHPRGHERGWDEVRTNFYKKTMADMFSKRDLRVNGTPAVFVYGGTAVVEFDWDFEAIMRDDGSTLNTKGRETQVFVKKGGDGWRLAHVHYSGAAVTARGQGF